MKIAVTGASGFIGRHVLSELQHHAVDVIAVTRDSGKLSDHKENAQIVEMDIAKPDDEAFDKLGRPDMLIHLSWEGLPDYMSLHHFESELPMQYQFLRRLIISGLPAVLITGTCFEYGMQSGCLSEDLIPLPSNPYGYAKDALRRQLEFLKNSYQFSLTWARLFFMYGEGQGKNSLFSQLKTAVKRGDSRFNMSGGEQLRDFLPVTEICHYLVTLAIEQADVGIINVCSGRPLSVRSLVEGWLSEKRWKILLNLGYFPYPTYEPMAFWGDRSKLDRLVGNNA